MGRTCSGWRGATSLHLPARRARRDTWQSVEGIRAAGATQPWTGHWNLRAPGRHLHRSGAKFAPLMEANGVYQYARAVPIRRPRLRRPSAEAGVPAREHLRARAPGQRGRAAVPQGLVVVDALRCFGHGMEQPLPLEVRIGPGHLSRRGTATPTGPSRPGRRSSTRPGRVRWWQLHRFFEGLPWYRLGPRRTVLRRRPALVTAGQRFGRGPHRGGVHPRGRPGGGLRASDGLGGTGASGWTSRASAGPGREPRSYDPVAGVFVDARPRSRCARRGGLRGAGQECLRAR